MAYDFETTNIGPGTPIPLYLTAYGSDMNYAEKINGMAHLALILVNNFLTEERLGTKFVAWNGNRFDAYFVAAALLRDGRFRIRPFLTKSKALRGMKITRIEDADNQKAKGWEFLCGMAMLGLPGLSLEKFLANFAPEYKKLSGTIDFEAGEVFDPENPAHCSYAMRDSVGLYHGMVRAQQIMLQTFDEPLAVTMGGVCIKIFQAHIPHGILIEPLNDEVESITRQFVMRGGYCYHVKRYSGPIWKYDINQCYAAAMRETPLPCGGMLHGHCAPPDDAICFIARIKASSSTNTVPFYHRSIVDGRTRSLFSMSHIPETWVTAPEYRQLESEGWCIECLESYLWSESFSMVEYVDKLERLRTTAEGGPSGPIGTMVKATGNHSYGKTGETIEPLEYVLAAECPEDCEPFYGDGSDPLEHVFYKFDTDMRPKAYHAPQIASFITSHARMVLRRAILKNPDTWLYADTDCLVFSADVTADFDIDSKRYGAWKIEESGTLFRMIGKKVYASHDGKKVSAKGMNVRKLTPDDFADWYDGDAPEQVQTQINNFLGVLHGADMYRTQKRSGTKVAI